jgi:hypothetical protein
MVIAVAECHPHQNDYKTSRNPALTQHLTQRSSCCAPAGCQADQQVNRKGTLQTTGLTSARKVRVAWHSGPSSPTDGDGPGPFELKYLPPNRDMPRRPQVIGCSAPQSITAGCPALPAAQAAGGLRLAAQPARPVLP